MNKTILCLSSYLLLMVGCTCTNTMIHTQGTASDMIDDTPTISPATTLSIPLTPKVI